MNDTTNTVSDWDAAFAGELDDGAMRRLVASSAAEIEVFLAADTETEEETLDILRRRLRGDIGPQTYDVVISALANVLGERGAKLLHWYQTSESEDEVKLFEEEASHRVLWFVRRILASHGPELRRAWALVKEPADDWRSISREIYYDILNDRHLVRHRIEKVNGDEVVFEGNADSALQLARALLITVQRMSPDSFTPAVIDGFLEDADNVLSILRSEPSTDGAPTQSSPV